MKPPLRTRIASLTLVLVAAGPAGAEPGPGQAALPVIPATDPLAEVA